MKTCKDCAYDKMCFLTHASKDLACCELEPSTISELGKIKRKLILKLSKGFDFGITEALNIIDEEIAELKGENK